jgi:hypothetical protein
MFKRSLSRMGDIAKNSINASIKGEGNLTKNRSSKPFSEAAQRNKGEGITPTKPSEQNNTPSNLEKLRRFHRYKPESNPQDSILYAKPGDPAYPGSPAAFDPRLTSSHETPKTLPKERPKPVHPESKPQDSILNAKPGDPAYPGSTAAFDPRLISSHKIRETLPKELSRLLKEGKIPPGILPDPPESSGSTSN